MSTPLLPAAAPDAVVVVPEPHAERPARPGEFCDHCIRRAFVVYLLPGGRVSRWCGWPETEGGDR